MQLCATHAAEPMYARTPAANLTRNTHNSPTHHTLPWTLLLLAANDHAVT